MPPLRSISEVEVNSSPTRRKARSASSSAADRFIPSRGNMDLRISAFEVEKAVSEQPEVNASPAKEAYKRLLARHLFHGEASCNRVLPIGGSQCNLRHDGASSSSNCGGDSLRMLYNANVRNRLDGQQGG